MRSRIKIIEKVSGFIKVPFDVEGMSDKELHAWSEFIDFMERKC